VCARRRSNFLLSRQEKVTKEKTTPSLRPPFALSGERGQPAMLGPGVVPQNSLRLAVGQTPFKQLRQARSRSACVLRHTHPPQALRFSAQPAGVGSGDRDGCCFAATPGVGSRCALPTCGARSLWRAERSEGPQAERSNGPSGARSHPLLTVPRSAEAGVARVPKDTRASSSGSPQMFERSSKNAASSEAHPSFEHRRLPPRHRRGGHGQRGRLLFGDFLLATQEKVTAPPGAHPGLRPQQRHAATTETKPRNNGLDPRLHSPAKQSPGRTARPLQLWRALPRRSLQAQVAVAARGLTRTATAVTD